MAGPGLGGGVTAQCTLTVTLPGDDNLTLSERIGIAPADNEGNRLQQQATTVVNTPDLVPQIAVTAIPDPTNGTGEATVSPGEVISCSAQIVNLTEETLTLTALNFRLVYTPTTGSPPTEAPLSTPAGCTLPATVEGLGVATCQVTTTVPTTTRHGDQAACAVTATAIDDDRGTTAVAATTEAYLIVIQPTDLTEEAEPATPVERIFLPLITQGAAPEE